MFVERIYGGPNVLTQREMIKDFDNVSYNVSHIIESIILTLVCKEHKNCAYQKWFVSEVILKKKMRLEPHQKFIFNIKAEIFCK